MKPMNESALLAKLAGLEERYEALSLLLADPDVLADQASLQTLAREQSNLEPTVSKVRTFRRLQQEIEEARALASDADPLMAQLGEEEVQRLEPQHQALWQQLELALLPSDPHDERDVFIEIRAGAGGDEAALFAADLFRMYTRYALAKGWQAEVVNANEIGRGGFKEIIIEVRGRGAYSRLKYESGVHRVQRVPVTESSGRIHTSTATVAVLPKAEERDLVIDPAELRIDVYHASGHGGQNVQKVETAVRITHIPTGIVVTCQDERSQLRNKERALAVLRARLLERERERRQEELSLTRRSQVGSGDRSEKSRTYNYPQNRVTDHRAEITLHNLPAILEGDLDPLIDAVAVAEQTRQLEAVS